MSEKKVKLFSRVLIFITVFFSIYLIYYSATIPGLNINTDKIKASLLLSEKINNTVEGSIVDANGIIITCAEKPGIPAQCVSNAYSHLVGFRDPVYGNYGLRDKYEQELLTTAGKNNIGATINLSIVSSIQDAAFNAIKNTDGCIVVIENSTGKILALTTSSKTGMELDANSIQYNWEAINKIDGFLIPNWEVALAPGSSIKPLVATMLYDKGYANEIYTDTGEECISNDVFRNSGNAAYGDVTLHEAIVNSINTYFAHYTSVIGRFGLQDCLENAAIGSTLDLDFGTINSSHELGNCSDAEVTATGFGQGKLMMTPINIAMIGQAIANDGKMLKPFLVNSIQKSNGRYLYKGKTQKVGKICSEEAADYVKQCMKDAADSYEIDSSLNLCAKTGTAELIENNRAVLLSFNDKVTVCAVENFTDKFGIDLETELMKVYNEVHDYYIMG